MFARRLLAVPVLLALTAPLRAADVDPHLPTDTRTYVAINVRQVLDSPLVKRHLLGPAQGALEELGVENLFKEMGFNPLKDIDRVLISSPGGKETDRGLIIVRGKFGGNAFKKAIEGNDDIKSHKTPLGGGVTHTVYELAQQGAENSWFFALANDKTIVVSPGKDYVVDALKQGKTDKQPVLKNKAIQQMIERLDEKQSLAILVPGKLLSDAVADVDIVPQNVKTALQGLDVIGGGITVSDELRLDLAISTKDENAAKAVRETTDKALKLALVGLSLVDNNKELGVVLEVVKTLRIGGRGKQVTLTARLPADVLDDLLGK